MGENPGAATLTGGAIVLAAVLANEAFAAWRGRGAARRTRPRASTASRTRGEHAPPAL